MELTTYSLTPMRSGSKRLPGKNIQPLLGKPLCAWTIDAAQRSGVCKKIIVATDSPAIADIAHAHGATDIIMLPEHCTQDNSPVIDSLAYCARYLRERNDVPDITLLLEATSFRLPHHITEALTLLQSTGADSAVSIIPLAGQHHPEWAIRYDPSHGKISRYPSGSLGTILPQKSLLQPAYTRNGAVYAFRTSLLFKNPPTIYGEDVRGYIMDPTFNIDIDTEEDFEAATIAIQKFAAR